MIGSAPMRGFLLGCVFLIACGDDGTRHLDDAPLQPDARPIDAAVVPAYDLTSGAQNVRGSRFSADVQIGHGISQQPSTGATKRFEANSAVKP